MTVTLDLDRSLKISTLRQEAGVLEMNEVHPLIKTQRVRLGGCREGWRRIVRSILLLGDVMTYTSTTMIKRI